ncbi:Glycosyl transferase family 2 [Flavobacterium resistens]|uniref:Glycosyl transferase family 2 n=1 Tax=Flavobacterium resistens TaxID=443612 RepID=A0A521ERY0_9FLAO|nr:glycosyltransferase [Flavobacterium resistens]MRX67934.1 glycosyltransferase [Flavobacterium resistens]SMO86657.1 Glycosyl transferase family 2 [Flavobacterium resistens]
MENYNKLLSVIIPTKNRYECLYPVVSALLKYIESENVEFIIQDNSDVNSEALLFFNTLKDDRVKYFYHPGNMSIIENTILAIDNAAGKYQIFIGDDDLVSPYIYEFALFMDKENIKSLVYNPAYYWWNTVEFINETYFHRKKALWLPNNQLLQFVEKNSDEELNIMLESGAGIFQGLPKFYHGIVRRDVLEEIKNITGTYLPGASPDIAFSTAIAFVIDKYFYVNFPVSIFGASKNSGGGMTARNKHYGKIEEQKHLPKKTIDNWNPLVPKIWSEKTIYAQTVTEVLSEFNSSKKFNYISFYGTMLAYEPYLFSELLKSVKKYCQKNIIDLVKISLVFFKKKTGIWYRKIRFLSKTNQYNVIIAEDVDYVMKTLKESKIEASQFHFKK